MIGALKALFGKRAPRAIPDDLWRRVVADLPFLEGLTPDQEIRLRELTGGFLAGKTFDSAEGLALSDEICLSIAVQGCLPVLNLGLDWYAGWHGVIVYPDEFVIPREVTDEHGIVHRYDEIAAGEAWGGGPLIVSWRDAQMTDGEYNVVIHEFAHKIDMLSGEADGCPPLQKNQAVAAWRADWSAAYEDFCRRVDAAPLVSFVENDERFEEIDLDSALDPYAAEAPAEFFAVASEVFFTAPWELRDEYPAVYAQLATLYRQDPTTRLGRLLPIPASD